MVGSNRPRPATPGKPRWGRPLAIETEIGGYDPPDLSHDPSAFFVEGRAYVTFWATEKRAKFNRFVELAKEFGLVVHEVDPSAEAPRRTWTRKRFDLELMRLAIKDAPGILFDDWCLLYLEGSPDNAPTRAAARRKAAMALSRLYVEGKVAKAYASDGRLILYLPEDAPKKDRANE